MTAPTPPNVTQTAETIPADVLLLARRAAARAQSNEAVSTMILSGKFDAWPNVKGAAFAIMADRARSLSIIERTA